MNLDFLRHIKHSILGHPTLSKPKQAGAADIEKQKYSEQNPEFDIELGFEQVARKFTSANQVYAYMHHYFHNRAPQFLREHRLYFSTDGRGFGEDAMHTMWWLLFLEFKPSKCLEIGVYRGQVISLWTLLAKVLKMDAEIWGISPLSPSGDEASGGYREGIDYADDIASHFTAFELGQPQLTKAYSTEPLAKERVDSQLWDLIYIDGSHDYDVVISDYRICKDQLAPGGILVFDDAAKETDYTPPAFAFAGHDDPSRLAVETVMKEMKFLGNVGHNMIFQNDSPAQASSN